MGAPLTRIIHQAAKNLVAQAFQPVQKTLCFFGLLNITMHIHASVAPNLASCPACGSSVRRPWLSQEIAGARFNLDKCGACGTGYVNPPPSAASLQSFYACCGHGSKSLTTFAAVMASEAEFPNSTVDARRLVTYAQKLLGPSRRVRRKPWISAPATGFSPGRHWIGVSRLWPSIRPGRRIVFSSN